MTPEQAAHEYAKDKYGDAKSAWHINHLHYLDTVSDFLAGHAHAQNRWVKVEDELPQPNEKVIAIHQYGKIKLVGYLNVDQFKRKDMFVTEDGAFIPAIHFTHWQPLPQPPENG